MSTKKKDGSSKPKKEEFQFETDMEPLLHLLTHSLYTNPDIYLRELISNSADAIGKMRFKSLTDPKILGDDAEFKVKLEYDDTSKTLSISDNGVGMTREDLTDSLGTIARSGTGLFAKSLTGDTKKDMDLIGRFGVGFYSVFMVTDEVTIETKHYDSSEALSWVSKGKGTYTIEPSDRKERGTKITFKFKKAADNQASPWQIRSIVKRYSDYIPYPIELDGEKINRSTPIWAKNKSEVKEDEYKDLYKYLSHKNTDPLEYIHINAEAPLQFNAVFYIPTDADRNLFAPDQKTKTSLYVKKVFIQDDCEALLPSWMRFIYGVVDTEDLPLNVSREVTQSSPTMDKLNKLFVKKLISTFENWAKKDPEKFETFWNNFGTFFKEAIHSDFEHREKVIELFRAKSSKSDGKLIPLREYVDRMQSDQKEIYYVFGKNKDQIEKSPNMELFLKNDIEVLYLHDEIDEFIMPMIGTYKEKPVVSVEKVDTKSVNSKIQKDKNEDISDHIRKKMVEYFKDILNDKVGAVIESDRLVDNPYTMVAGKDAVSPHMERMMRMMNQDYQESKKILELNMDSSLLVNLCKIREMNPQDKIIRECIEQIYDNCNLLESDSENGANTVIRMNGILERMTTLYIDSKQPAKA